MNRFLDKKNKEFEAILLSSNYCTEEELNYLIERYIEADEYSKDVLYVERTICLGLSFDKDIARSIIEKHIMSNGEVLQDDLIGFICRSQYSPNWLLEMFMRTKVIHDEDIINNKNLSQENFEKLVDYAIENVDLLFYRNILFENALDSPKISYNTAQKILKTIESQENHKHVKIYKLILIRTIKAKLFDIVNDTLNLPELVTKKNRNHEQI